jgi:hypothetical protein
MSWSKHERLYNLLPAVYRIQDAKQGEPLRALLSVIECELEKLEADIDGLYKNWFIETCGEWVIPYIGDLVGARLLHTIDSAGIYSLRAYVANTLRYRRRKGTATVLEQLARDVSGWPARAVEFFKLLAATQYMNHIRLHSPGSMDLRDFDGLDLLGTPFETAPHTVEVRRIASKRGKYNIRNIGLFLWRLQSYPIVRGTPRPVGTDNSRYTFHPLGYDAPLFNQPQTETEITHLAEEVNVPSELRRLALWEDLENYRQELLQENSHPTTRYFGDQPVLTVFLSHELEPQEMRQLNPEELQICDLSDWDEQGWTPPASKTYTLPDGTSFSTQVGIDPEWGRLVILGSVTHPHSIEVSFSYGFSGNLGGGPYDRPDSLLNLIDKKEIDKTKVWLAYVSTAADDSEESVYTSLADAVNAWKKQTVSIGVISVVDSRTYTENLTTPNNHIIIPGASNKLPSRLFIIAGSPPRWLLDITETDVPRSVQKVIDEVGHDVRPHLDGNLSVKGTAAASALPGELIVDGLLIEGKVTVLAGNLGALRLVHSTMVPEEGGLSVSESKNEETQNINLCISLERTICGPILLPPSVLALTLRDSIVDSFVNNESGTAIDTIGAAATVKTSTVFGATNVRSLDASEAIFTGQVQAKRRQIGCVRFCYVPPGSQIPRRYRCQPDLALQAAAGNATEEENTLRRILPRFTSEKYGDPAYAQLSRKCPEEISTGAEDGSEMGAFNHLKQPQREANLRAALDEYLRFGLEAGIFYIT